MEQNDLIFFKKNGYLCLKSFFPEDKIIQVLEDSKNVFLRQFIRKKYVDEFSINSLTDDKFNQFLYRLFDDDLACFSNCGKQIQHLISLHSLSLDDKIISILNQIGISAPVISTRPVLYFNHPKLAKERIYHTVDAHQDWRSMQGSLNSVVIWIPLININKDLGALEILPGSHLDGLRTNHVENSFGMVSLTKKEKEKLISIEVKAGDILLFSSFLIHQSGNNITNSPRWSCHFRYNCLDEKTFIDRGFAHPYIYKPIEKLITKDFPSKTQLIDAFE